MSQYTPEAVQAVAQAMQTDDATHYAADAAHMLEDYAATLHQAPAQGGVTEAMWQAVDRMIVDAWKLGGCEKTLDMLVMRKRYDDAIAALSAPEPAAQGEAVAYFSADPAEGWFNMHKTLSEAVAGAEAMLESAQDDASDYGWQDEPPQICYGVVLGGCVEKEGSRRPAPEGSEFTALVDYRLTAPPAQHAERVPDIRVSAQGVRFGPNCWYSHEYITGFDAARLNKGECNLPARQYMKWLQDHLAASTAPSPARGDGGEVDVLAVMAEMESFTEASYPHYDSAETLKEARDAVAEVFEASADLEKAVREETEHLKASAFRDISECDRHRVFENRVVEATDRLRTALRNAGVKS